MSKAANLRLTTIVTALVSLLCLVGCSDTETPAQPVTWQDCDEAAKSKDPERINAIRSECSELFRKPGKYAESKPMKWEVK